MRSSGKSGGRGNPRGAGGNRDQRQGQGRPGKPRPEERRYDVGPEGAKEGPKSGRGGAKPSSQKGGGRGGRTLPGRSREYETRMEERNRDRYAGKKDIKANYSPSRAPTYSARLQIKPWTTYSTQQLFGCKGP